MYRVEQTLVVASPRERGELDPVDLILEQFAGGHLQDANRDPVAATLAGAISEIGPIVGEGIG